MAIFTYKALASESPSGPGADVTGTITADSPGQARQLLRERGLAIYELVASRRSQWPKRYPWFARLRPRGIWGIRGRRYKGQTVEFIRELSTLLAVGTPMVSALDTIIKQWGFDSGSRIGGFQSILINVREQVAAGSTLSDALQNEPEVFDELSINLVAMGEQSGTLDTVLDRLAEFKERSQQLRGKVGGALIYPCIVLVMAVLITLLLMTFVVPNILKPLTQAGRPLPWITLTVKTLSDGLIGYWWLLLIGVLTVAITVTAILRTKRGLLRWHRWQLAMPLVGSLVRKQAVVRIALIISTMMRSGLVFLKALEVAKKSSNNLVIQQALEDCKNAVHGGRDIAEALDQSGVFPPTVVQVFALGQQSGRLEDMLDRLAEGYDKQVTAATQRLTAVLEPVMILLLALVVGAIAFATVLPILEAGHAL